MEPLKNSNSIDIILLVEMKNENIINKNNIKNGKNNRNNIQL